MSTTSHPEQPPNTAIGQEPKVTCSRCQTESPADTLECPTCGRHLSVYCGACGELNPRAAVRCKACMHQLRVRRHRRHAPALQRLVWPRRWDWSHRPRWVLPAQILASLLAIFLGVQAILLLHARFAVPRGPGTEELAELYVMPDGKIVELPPDTSFEKQIAD